MSVQNTNLAPEGPNTDLDSDLKFSYERCSSPPMASTVRSSDQNCVSSPNRFISSTESLNGSHSPCSITSNTTNGNFSPHSWLHSSPSGDSETSETPNIPSPSPVVSPSHASASADSDSDKEESYSTLNYDDIPGEPHCNYSPDNSGLDASFRYNGSSFGDPSSHSPPYHIMQSSPLTIPSPSINSTNKFSPLLPSPPLPSGVTNYSPTYSDIDETIKKEEGNKLQDDQASTSKEVKLEPPHLREPFYSFSPKHENSFSSYISDPILSPSYISPCASPLPPPSPPPTFSSAISSSDSSTRNIASSIPNEAESVKEESVTVNEALDAPIPSSSTDVIMDSENTSNPCVVDLTCDDDDIDDNEVEIVSMDQPVVFLGRENTRRKRKRRRIDPQLSSNNPSSSTSEEPILICDSDNVPCNTIDIRDSPEHPASRSPPILVESTSCPSSLTAQQQEPQFFGDLLNRSVVPLEREAQAHSSSVLNLDLQSGSERNVSVEGSSSCTCYSREEGSAAGSGGSHCPIPGHNRLRRINRGARSESHRTIRSMMEEPIPQNVLNDVSAIYAEDIFMRELMSIQRGFSSTRPATREEDVGFTRRPTLRRSIERSLAPLASGGNTPPLDLSRPQPDVWQEPGTSGTELSGASGTASDPSSFGSRLSNSSFLRSLSSFFIGSSTSDNNTNSSNTSSSIQSNSRCLRSMVSSSSKASRMASNSATNTTANTPTPSNSSKPSCSRSRSSVSVASSSSQNLGEEPGGFSCPICFESFQEIKKEGKTISSTVCGHIFCTDCLEASFRQGKKCPTCRKKLNKKQYHPLYI